VTEVNPHTPTQVDSQHCRRLWGVLGTAGEPVVHYCCTPAIDAPVGVPVNPHDIVETQRVHVELTPTHRCSCGASTGEEGARLLCRFREPGADACGRLVTSVETATTSRGPVSVSMPCGHPVTPVGKPTDRRSRRGNARRRPAS
jgi:hypothetical protein